MRGAALWILAVFWMFGTPLLALAEDSDFPIGKPVPRETVQPVAAGSGQHLETPNQRRRRMGETITASFPSPDYGEALETPNQRRQRLINTQTIAQTIIERR